MGVTVGLLIPLLGTMLGAAFVFFMKKDMSPRVQKSLLGFACRMVVPHTPIHALICCWCHVLCGSRRVDPRGLVGRAFQPQHYRFRHWICADDGIGCGDKMIKMKKLFFFAVAVLLIVTGCNNQNN